MGPRECATNRIRTFGVSSDQASSKSHIRKFVVSTHDGRLAATQNASGLQAFCTVTADDAACGFVSTYHAHDAASRFESTRDVKWLLGCCWKSWASSSVGATADSGNHATPTPHITGRAASSGADRATSRPKSAVCGAASCPVRAASSGSVRADSSCALYGSRRIAMGAGSAGL